MTSASSGRMQRLNATPSGGMTWPWAIALIAALLQ
jgi:hypothetical protein